MSVFSLVSFQCGENQRINYVSKLFENMKFEHSKSSASEDFRRYICYASIVSTRLFNGRKLHDIPKSHHFSSYRSPPGNIFYDAQLFGGVQYLQLVS